jgi:hypothetical protein
VPRFVIQPGVPQQEEAIVTGAITLTQDFLNDGHGGILRDRVVVLVTSVNMCQTAFHGGDGVICINVGEPGWLAREPYEKTATVAHEYFHNLQTEIGCRFSPIWLAEGSAEYFGYQVAIWAGQTDAATVHQRQLLRARAGDALPPLEATSVLGDDARAYGLWYLAVEQLLAGGNVRPLRRFCANVPEGMSQSEAFEEAFGRSFDTYFAEFAAWRQENGV